MCEGYRFQFLKKSKGFSLIELLVVVAIIAILASIGVVSYMKYIANAKYSKIEALLRRSAMIAEETYAEKDAYPVGSCDALASSSDVVCSVNDSLTVITGDTGNPVFRISPKMKVTFTSDGKILVESSLLKGKSGGNAKLALTSPDEGSIQCYDDEIHGKKWTSPPCP